jgi:hypothetical protein
MDLLTLAEARALAAKEVGEGHCQPSGVCPLIVDSATIVRDWGWIFFYENKQRLETGNFRFGMVGNHPVVVRKDGRVEYLPRAGRTLEESVLQYEIGNSLR